MKSKSKKIGPRKRHQYNYTPEAGRVNNQESKTIQGESYTIAELMQRNSSGLHTDIIREGHFDEEPTHDSVDMNQIRGQDMVEQDQVLQDQMDLDIQNFEAAKKEGIEKNEEKTKTKEDKKEVESEAKETTKKPDAVAKTSEVN